MEFNMAIFALLFAALTSFATLLTAVLRYMQIRTTNRQSQVSVFLKFQDRFSEEGMARAIRALHQFRDRHGEEFVDVFKSMHFSNTEEGEEINDARQRVSNYYFSLSNALAAGAISKDLAHTVTTAASFRALTEISVPMNESILEREWGSKHVERLIEVRERKKRKALLRRK